MRVTVQHALKVPDTEQYSSRQHSVAMEVDVPEDAVAKGKDGIREFVARVTNEVRSYVEEALAGIRVEQQEREPVATSRTGPSSRAVPNGHSGPRPPANGRAPRRQPVRSGARPNGDGNGNGQANGDAASVKQINYLRSLANEAGYSADQLAYLAQEVVGKDDIRSLTKKDASAMIDQLRSGQQ